MQPTLKHIQEMADQFGFTITPCSPNTSRRKLFLLRADWAYSDGYRPATPYALTAKEAYIYLTGFAAGKYE